MKFLSLAALAGFAGLAYGQFQCISSALAINSCATPCILSQASSVGCTGLTDFKCQCDNQVPIAAACAVDIALSCQLQAVGVVTGVEALCMCVSANQVSTSPGGGGGGGVGGGAISTPTLPASVNVSPTLSPSLPLSVPGNTPIGSVPGGVLSSASAGSASSPKATSSAKASSSVLGGAGSANPSGKGGAIPTFTGAAATAGAFLPVGGAIGAIMGVLAYL